jgi:serine/threonine kinase PknH
MHQMKTLTVFVSYTRDDRSKLQPVLDGLHRLGHRAWFDEELTGGKEWWTAILGRIRQSDALLLALSPAVIDSAASMEEVRYAISVGKPVLPVMVESVSTKLLPPEIGSLHIVDYTAPVDRSAFDFIAAMAELEPPGPLPDPLPELPPMPLSYAEEVRKVQAPNLSVDEQLSLVTSLKWAMKHKPREDDRIAAVALLKKLGDRRDISKMAADEIDRALEARPETSPAHVPGPTPWPAQQPATSQIHSMAPVATPASHESGFWVGALTIFGLLFFAPLALITVWFTRWSSAAKVIVAVIAVVWIVVVIAVLAGGSSSG